MSLQHSLLILELLEDLNYLPGAGASGIMNVTAGQNTTIANVTINTVTSVSSGTDNIGANMVKSILFPNANVLFTHTNVLSNPPATANTALH